MSIIIPVDEPRLKLLYNTLNKYLTLNPVDVEFLIVTRSLILNDFAQYLKVLNIRIINYSWNASTFSQTMALNHGILAARSECIVVTSPEVMPSSDVISQLKALAGKNVVCQVFDTNEQGEVYMSLVNTNFRSQTPAYHFLAMYNKKDLEFINGWDEDFMMGQAYDDDDFGSRFSRAGIPWEMHDEITAVHQWHPRNPIGELWAKDNARYLGHIADGVIQVKNGLYKLERDNEDTSKYVNR